MRHAQIGEVWWDERHPEACRVVAFDATPTGMVRVIVARQGGHVAYQVAEFRERFTLLHVAQEGTR